MDGWMDGRMGGWMEGGVAESMDHKRTQVAHTFLSSLSTMPK